MAKRKDYVENMRRVDGYREGEEKFNGYMSLNDIDKHHPMFAQYGMLLCDGTWVNGYRRKDGTIVYGYCRRNKGKGRRR